MVDPIPGAATVTDTRVPPRGVMPRHLQTWIMVGLAIGIVGIIGLTGRPQPTRERTSPSAAPTTPNPDRLREYQERLRGLDTRPAPAPPTTPTTSVPTPRPPSETHVPAPPPDPTDADRKRREYESLFAGNVVVSRRPEAQRLTTNDSPARSVAVTGTTRGTLMPPNLDEVADAVVRATSRLAPASRTSVPIPALPPAASPPVALASSDRTPATPPSAATGPITDRGPIHRLLEGTVIDTVLTNRLEGSVAAPVNCLVTSPVYAPTGEVLLIPAGARVLGQTKPVQAAGETRLAVAFTRLMMPDGRTYPLDRFIGLNSLGDAGLRDQVNLHYQSTFGAATAIGLLSGFGQFVAGAGLTRATGTSPVIIAGGASEATTQATAQTMNRFLNRLPTVTIREGHRVKVYLTSDLELPAYEDAIDLRRTPATAWK
jgi:type IV secretion system protein VirB10